MFVSTLFSLFNLAEPEMKAMNLFHRTSLRAELELIASKVVTDMMKITTKMMKSFKMSGQSSIANDPELQILQRRVVLNLKHVKAMKRQLDIYKLETLYFEDDMLTKIDRIRMKEKEALSKTISIEKIYKEIFLDTNILNIKSIDGTGNMFQHPIIKKIVVKSNELGIHVCRCLWLPNSGCLFHVAESGEVLL